VKTKSCSAAAVILLSVTALGQINLTQGRPLGVGANGVLSSSPQLWDCSQLSGLTLDIQLNTCNALAITSNGGVVDARGLGGPQTIASEVNIGQLLAPVLTSPSGTSPGAGTYKLVYTLTSSTETSASQESIITITGSQSIQVASPTYYGTATSYSVYMCGGGSSCTSWSEDKCAAATNVTIGTNATITATCAGSAVSKSNNGFGVSLIPPKTGIWTVTIVDSVANTSCGLKFFDDGSFEGQSAGEGRSWYLTSNSSTNIEALFCTDNNPKNGSSYYQIRGMAAHGTGSDLIQTATCIMRGAFDVSRFDDMGCVTLQTYPAGYAYGTLTIGVGAGTRVSGSFEASSIGQPLVIGVTAGATTLAWDFNDISAVHPGNTYPNINVVGGVRSLHFSGITYLEGPSSGSCSDAIQLATGASMPGPIIFDNVHHGANCSGTNAAYLVSVPGSFTLGDLQVHSTFTGNFTHLFKYNPNTNLSISPVATATTYPQFTMDNNNPVTMTTSFNGRGGMIPPVQALSSLPSCTAANEGIHVVATTCTNAGGCVAGNACGSGTLHCELYCNSAAAYVETGR
jgi:hypothetical protein